ncbi:hypothetical protein U9M48_041829, partial [Paspalum notatum var. saurae]
MLRLRSHLLPLLRATSPLLSPTHHHGAIRLLSTSPAPFSLEDYLVAACGLTPHQARKASKKAFDEASKIAGKPFDEFSRSRLNTASNVNAVLALLSGVGLSRADIAAVVVEDPLMLRSSPKIIGPRLVALRDRIGLSTHQIYQLISVGSRALRHRDVVPMVEFLISFFGSFQQALVAVKRNYSILWGDLDRVVKPNIAQFLQCGLSAPDTAHMCSYFPRLLLFNPERVKDFLLHVDELGVPRSSRMFMYAVAIAASIGKEKAAARIDLLKSALGGCSEVAFAVSRMPNILGISEERLLPKIQFLLNEVGLEPQYILERPTLLCFSLEKRLVPRHCVMKLLQANGLMNRDTSFYTVAASGERTFRLKYVDCHKDSVPGLADAYAAATVGGFISSSREDGRLQFMLITNCLLDYLVAACGLAPDQARKASKKAFEEASKHSKKPFEELSHSRLNTASNPDAILALLAVIGLSRADIAAVVCADPLILRSSAKITGPRLVALRDRVGLSTHQIYQLLLVGSQAVRCGDVCSKLEFFVSFFGSFEQILAATKKCSRVLTSDLDRTIKPNIEQLRQCGLSARDIAQLYLHYPRLAVYNQERVREFVLRAEALGVRRSSRTFKYAVGVAACITKEKVAARVAFLKSALGCSETEVAIAVSKMPSILGISNERLLPKIRFLIDEVGFEPRYIVEKPSLLGYSLEKRLLPRHRVMKLLHAKGLLSECTTFFSLVQAGEQAFRSKLIDRHKDSVPGLADAYAAATDYLVAACGISADQARKASKKAFEEASKRAGKPLEELCNSRSRLNTVYNPAAILALLDDVGLSREDTAAVVAADLLLLRSKPKNVGPRLLGLRDRLGMSTPQIVQFLLVGSRALRWGDVCSKLEFLIPFLGSFERLLAATKKCSRILCADLDRAVKPNVEQLRQCGLSVQDIAQLCSHYPRLLAYNQERVKEFVLRAEALGVPRSSRMFKYAVGVAARIRKEKAAARLACLKSALGCSESEIAIAVSKMPTILEISEERLLPKIRFLIDEVGFEPRYIVERPSLLGFSLEKRLLPRHCVMKLLHAKGLLSKYTRFYSVAKTGEQTFRSKFIDCHEGSLPGLADAYAAATVGGSPFASPMYTAMAVRPQAPARHPVPPYLESVRLIAAEGMTIKVSNSEGQRGWFKASSSRDNKKTTDATSLGR